MRTSFTAPLTADLLQQASIAHDLCNEENQDKCCVRPRFRCVLSVICNLHVSHSRQNVENGGTTGSSFSASSHEKHFFIALHCVCSTAVPSVGANDLHLNALETRFEHPAGPTRRTERPGSPWYTPFCWNFFQRTSSIAIHKLSGAAGDILTVSHHYMPNVDAAPLLPSRAPRAPTAAVTSALSQENKRNIETLNT